MKSNSLEDKIIVVTGAGSGIGASVARRCAEDGARVIVADLNEAAAGRVATEIGSEASVFDVTDSVAFSEAIARVAERYGRIDGLVNNAGIAPIRDADRSQILLANQMKRMENRANEMTPTNDTVDLSDEQWKRMIDVHLNGTFFGTRAALGYMTPARAGSIVNISSILAMRPSAGAPHYCAAKAGIIAFTKSVAYEVAPFGVRVNAVSPGWVDTPLLEPFDDVTKAAITMQIPIGRMATASEVTDVVAFLLGSQSAYCVGEVFPVTGGWI